VPDDHPASSCSAISPAPSAASLGGVVSWIVIGKDLLRHGQDQPRSERIVGRDNCLQRIGHRTEFIATLKPGIQSKGDYRGGGPENLASRTLVNFQPSQVASSATRYSL